MNFWSVVAVAAAATLFLYVLFVVVLFIGGRKSVARVAGFSPDCLVLFSRLLRDRRMPRRGKLLLALLVGYLSIPFDLVPHFAPVAGRLDDAIIVAFVLRGVLGAGGPELAREHWPGPPSSLELVLKIAGYGRGAGRRGKSRPRHGRLIASSARHRDVGNHGVLRSHVVLAAKDAPPIGARAGL